MNILLVSTGPRVTSQVLTALVGGDVDYTEVRTPQRALALLDEAAAGGRVPQSSQGFDIVVGDADTAPTGGFALSREVKARAKMGAAMPPVLLLVAREQDQWLAEWSEADAWIVKPIDPFDLAEVVRALVGRRPIPALPGVGHGGGAMREEARRLEDEQAAEPGSLGSGS